MNWSWAWPLFCLTVSWMRSWILCPDHSTLWWVPSLHVSLSFFLCVFMSFHPCPTFSFCLQGDHLIRKSQPLLHHDPLLEAEVLDEVVLQPANHNQDQKLKHERDHKHRLEDMDTCIVRKQQQLFYCISVRKQWFMSSLYMFYMWLCKNTSSQQICSFERTLWIK